MQVILGLLVGYIIAAASKKDGLSYVTSDKISAAPAATFLWVETFNLGFYAPGLLPLLIAFVVTTVESIGDITATAEASRLPTDVRVFFLPLFPLSNDCPSTTIMAPPLSVAQKMQS